MFFRRKINLVDLVGKEIQVQNKSGIYSEKGFVYDKGNNKYEFLIPVDEARINSWTANGQLFFPFEVGNIMGEIIRDKTKI